VNLRCLEDFACAFSSGDIARSHAPCSNG
jgi:hypothetical protein